MSRYRSDPEMMMDYQQKPSACSNFLHYTWKTITCLLSHITLVSMVVAYCVLGAFTFEALEKEHEKDVKRNITRIRNNITDHLWKLTLDLEVLKPDNFTDGALIYLKEFENALLKAMTKDGWDGEEDTEKVQWTRTGALFYSIIVITTIGYGHIAPKTTWGKVATIFYAILGIPLMLLCLSNIGDIMATSFRFLYWRVCCYMCTKKPKKRKTRSLRSNLRYTDSRYLRSRTASIRRSVRTSTRSADSGLPLSESLHYSHSDTDLRYHTESFESNRRGSSLPRLQRQSTSRYSDSAASRRTQQQLSVPRAQQQQQQTIGGSLDRKKFPKGMLIELDPILLARTPILCNRYVIGQNEILANQAPGITLRETEIAARLSPTLPPRRAKSLPKQQQQRHLDLPLQEMPLTNHNNDTLRNRPKHRRSPPPPCSSPRMMTPLGYAHRSKYLDDPDTDDDEIMRGNYNMEPYYDDDYDMYDMQRTRIRPVPIWLCVFLVISYIIAGAFLFKSWENWDMLDAAYFCFITLTTIGFGDLVPAKGVKQDGYRATISIALCSLYLLFGIALLAMSFNLVQEEVIANVKSVAKTLGIIKKDSDDSDDDDEDV